jgi:hypothetical protein
MSNSDTPPPCSLDTSQQARDALAVSWRDPAPLPEPFGPPVPLEAFPRALRNHIDAVATQVRVSPDLVAGTVLGVVMIAAQRVGSVCVDSSIGHHEQMSFYIVSVEESGGGKTVVFERSIFPLNEYERRWRIDNDARLRDNARDRKTFTARAAKFIDLAARDVSGKHVQQYRTAAEDAEGQIPEELHPLELTTKDVTIEALAAALGQQEGCHALAMAESGTLLRGFLGRYGSGNDTVKDVDQILGCYSGEAIRVKRVERGTLEVPSPRLCVVGMAQPVLVHQMGLCRDLEQRGLWPRFVFIWPRSTIGSRLGRAPQVEHAQRYAEAYRDAIFAVLDIGVGNHVLAATREAEDIWYGWRDELERRIAPGRDLRSIASWVSKHRDCAFRIGGAWHLIRHGRKALGKPIERDSIEAAIKVCDWQLGHYIAIQGAALVPRIAQAHIILDWIKRSRVANFTLTDLCRELRDREDHEPALRVLEEHGYIQLVRIGARVGRGGRPGLCAVVHPSLRREQTP